MDHSNQPAVIPEQRWVAGIRTALLDITERVVAEARLMESQKWLATMLDSLAPT